MYRNNRISVGDYITKVKIAVAMTMIRNKPEEISAYEYSQHLCSRYKIDIYLAEHWRISPIRTQFFRFSVRFRQKALASEVGARRLPQLNGKSWIRNCKEICHIKIIVMHLVIVLSRHFWKCFLRSSSTIFYWSLKSSCNSKLVL